MNEIISLRYSFSLILRLTLFVILITITSLADQSLDGVYYYSYTKKDEIAPYRQDEIEPITVVKNNDNNFIAKNSHETVILYKDYDDPEYIGGAEIGVWILDDNGLYIDYGDIFDFYSKAPFYSGWVKCQGYWYHLDTNGHSLINQWVGNYYLGSDGAMITNSWTPDGYYVGADGAWDGQPAMTANIGLYSENSVYRKRCVKRDYGRYTG